MRPRGGYNPKRRLASLEALSVKDRQVLAAGVSYDGNPQHKRTPGDYGLAPPASPRPGKTLCDAGGPFPRTAAEELLRSGAAKGMVSVQRRDDWPQNIWAVSEDGVAFEAQLGNAGLGSYHGYPMPADDDFRRVIIREWSDR